jgi:hypothetical protein
LSSQFSTSVAGLILIINFELPLRPAQFTTGLLSALSLSRVGLALLVIAEIRCGPDQALFSTGFQGFAPGVSLVFVLDLAQARPLRTRRKFSHNVEKR